ncbi:MAG: hypothetical protein KC492_30060 [Myxococcales bacterium]|nr:hypothetical protein [Myxococcales bacterium]MCB9610631.1 hypothetical protein [Polyangiaceae bacterium]
MNLSHSKLTLLFALGLLAALPGCSASVSAGAEVQPATAKSSRTEPIWVRCTDGFKPTGLLENDIKRLGRDCAESLNMGPITPVIKASQSEQQPADVYTFYVPRAGDCFRVVSIGDSHIEDLDLLLRTPDGEPVAGDLTHDKFPVLPPYGPLCLDEPGLYLLEVSVFKGSGRYAVQVWGGEPAGQEPQPR